MEKRNLSVVAAAVMGLAACLAITIQTADSAPISWGNLEMAAGATDLADLVPAASNTVANEALLAGGLTGSLLLEGIPSHEQGLLGTFGYLQESVSPGRMLLNGSDLMPLYEHSVQVRGLVPRTESEWQEVSVGSDALQALALSPTRISTGLRR